MSVLTVLAIVVVVGFVAVCAIGVLVAWRLTHLARQSAVHLNGRLAAIRAGLAPPGPRRDAARLRRTLLEEMRATEAMLLQAPDGMVFRADARALLTELATTAGALDADLRNIERFADPARQRVALETVGPQAQQLIDTSYTARQVLLQTAVEDRERRLAALRDDVAAQAAAADRYQRDNRG